MATRLTVSIFCLVCIVDCHTLVVASDKVAAAREVLAKLENVQKRVSGAISDEQLVDARIDVFEAELDLALDAGNGTTTNSRVIELVKSIVVLEEKQFHRESELLEKQATTRLEHTYRLTRMTLAKVFLARVQNNREEAVRVMDGLIDHYRREVADFKELRANRIVTDEQVTHQETALEAAEVIRMTELAANLRVQLRIASANRRANIEKMLAYSEKWLARTHEVSLR